MQEKRPLKISYLTTYDAHDIHNWSGLGYYIAGTLEKQGAQLEYAGDLWSKLAPLPDLIRKYGPSVSRGRFFPEREDFFLRRYAAAAEKMISPDTDVIFSPGSVPLTLLKSPKPKVLYTDTTFASMMGYYPEIAKSNKRSIRLGHEQERRSLANCDLAIYASDWAAQSAVEDYGFDPARIRVVPFGANVEAPFTQEDIRQAISRRSGEVCKLVFSGVHWERKGGAMAVEIARQLHENGIPVQLDIIGIRDHIELPEYVHNHGFISKASTEGKALIDKLFLEANFFLLPTRAECFGVVFSEASSFGLPSLAPKTGGVTTAIKDGVNGMTFPLDATAQDYADYIAGLFNDRPAYEKLALSSYQDYKTRLNWNSIGEALMGHITELVESRK